MTLVDSNVLLDLVTDDPNWADWSQRQLAAASLRGPLLASDIVYAELSVRYERIEKVDELATGLGIAFERVPPTGLFLAAKAFLRYRAQGGTRTGVLPDFLIGAHAAATGMPLLTRDVRRYRTYFPTALLIHP